jgi:aminoglycoside phosphotransferase (APT) family kinase protein
MAPASPAHLPDGVVAALVEALPDARVSEASPLGKGYGTVAFRVPATAGDYVVRVCKPQSWWAAEDLEREVRLLPLIERAGFAIETPREARLLRGSDGSTLGALHRLVPGTPLVREPVQGHAAHDRLARDIAAFLSTLHAIPVAEAAAYGAREYDLWPDEYAPLVEQVLPLLGHASRAWLEDLVDEFVQHGASSCAPRVLIHGDVSGDNLLLDEGGALCGVIDFADAVIADPALDFAGVLNDRSWRFLERVWRHYALPFDPDVERRTRFYIAIAPIYRVLHGEVAEGPAERRAGLRQFAARAAAVRRMREP